MVVVVCVDLTLLVGLGRGITCLVSPLSVSHPALLPTTSGPEGTHSCPHSSTSFSLVSLGNGSKHSTMRLLASLLNNVCASLLVDGGKKLPCLAGSHSIHNDQKKCLVLPNLNTGGQKKMNPERRFSRLHALRDFG